MALPLTFVKWDIVTSKSFVLPSAITIVFVSVLFALFHTLFLDLSASFIEPGSHFPKQEWFATFSKPTVNVPLVEINDIGDYAEALARGTKEVCDIHVR